LELGERVFWVVLQEVGGWKRVRPCFGLRREACLLGLLVGKVLDQDQIEPCNTLADRKEWQSGDALSTKQALMDSAHRFVRNLPFQSLAKNEGE
jgi:hypothetical protein